MNNQIYYVYILASKPYGVLYIGFTKNLKARVYAHKSGAVKGFTQKYKVYKLVYYEAGEDYESLLQTEKQLKEWRRQWKLELINRSNPAWKDLYSEI
jgi:putative endonuclease